MKSGTPLSLSDVYRIADVAVRLGAAEYACRLCQVVVRAFPSDPRTRLLLGQALFEQGRLDEACHAADLVLELDPENVQALSAAGVAHSAAGQLNAALRAFERAYELNPGNTQVRDSLARLYTQRDGNVKELSPAPPVAVVRWRLRHDTLDDALDAVDQVLLTRPGDVRVLLARAEALWRAGRRELAEQDCRQILARHPRFLKPRLILGQILSADPKREVDGVEMLHGALAEDLGGVVAKPLFRETTFAPPTLAEAVVVALPDDLASVPAEIDAALDVLPTETGDDVEFDWRPPDEVLDPAIARAIGAVQVGTRARSVVDGSTEIKPSTDAECLLAISCRGPLVARYGFEGFQRLERRLQTVARELAFVGTRFVIAFVDDPGSMAQHELTPVWSTDPKEIKRAIDDLDRVVGQDGRGVDGILIVGGDDVVPFFHAVNPADDDDAFVLSDSPYAVAPGGSVYAPEIPIGRLPDGSGGNLNVLLRQIDTLLELRRKPSLVDVGPRIVQAGLAALGAIGLGVANSLAFGCAASSFETVAGQAFAAIAPPSLLRLSPPTIVEEFNAHWISGRRFLYFNLHGAPNTAAWYGACEPGDTDEDRGVPVALTPDRLSEADLGAPVVFSEASHGAHTVSRSVADSLALRFLSEGATAFIGSTALAYGGARSTLVGADLLARLFWTNLRDGDRIGVALQRARRQYVHHVVEQQGYLDGDDQKTLLEFVLYGDPLMPVFTVDEEIVDDVDGAVAPPLPLICNQTSPEAAARPTAPRLLRSAIQHVVSACPELAGGTVRIHRRHACLGRCEHDGHTSSAGAAQYEGTGIIVATSRKEMATSDGSQLVKIARATLSESGDLVKFVVSR